LLSQAVAVAVVITVLAVVVLEGTEVQ